MFFVFHNIVEYRRFQITIPPLARLRKSFLVVQKAFSIRRPVCRRVVVKIHSAQSIHELMILSSLVTKLAKQDAKL